jgi:hypothetical protein
MDGSVYALAVSGTTLYAGGDFTTADWGATTPVSANSIAKWDGATSTWSALGTGVDDTVRALAVSGTSLYAGGYFSTAGGTTVNRIAKWSSTTSTWSALGTGMNDEVYALAVAPNGTLYAGGYFTTAGGRNANRIAQWNGSTWSALGTGMNDYVNALAVASDGTLYAGGSFSTAGGESANCIAKWDGSAWYALGPGMDGEVRALAVFGTTLYAGGNFSYVAGDVYANRIAKWEGGAWSALGSGLNGTVTALVVASNGTLYAGGSFSGLVARWDGSANDGAGAWSGLGGLDDGETMVNALAVASDGTLYAGGSFTNGVAKWDDSANGGAGAWSRLAGLDNGGYSVDVYALAVSGTTLYAGGFFTTAGGESANYIAKWGGSPGAWSPLGTGVNDSVYALALSGGTLYVGGGFTTAGGKASAYAAYAQTTAATTTTVASGLNPSTYGASVTFTATVSPGAATGTVTFKDGVTTLGTGTLSGGTATYATSALSVSDHSITAEYGGDGGYAASTASALTQTVNKATPSVTTWPTASAIIYGQTLASSILSGGSASVAGSFAWTTPATAPGVGTASQGVTFTPTDTANYNNVTGSVSVTVNPVTRSAMRDGPWNDPATWGGTLPGAGEDVVIPEGISVWLDVASPAIRNLTIVGTLALGANTLTLKGNFTNTGTFDPGTGTVVLTGSGDQTLSATAPGTLTFYNLTLNQDPKTATVTATSTLTVTQLLTITQGKLVSASDYADILIATDGTLVLTNDITVSGNLVIQGAGILTTAGHGITFDGGLEQNLTLASLTTFANLTVTAGTTLIETETADNAAVSGTLSNAGVIRKTQPVAATGAYHFGLAGNSGAGLSIAVTSLAGADPLSAIQVDRHAGNHPQAPGTNTTAIYWTVTPTGSDFIATVVLPHAAGLADPQVCRYRSSAWDGARSGFDATTVTRTGLTAFGDFAMFDDPQLATTTTLASTLNPSTYGASVTLTATVSTAMASGTVTFKDGATILGTGTVTAGTATYTNSTLAVGSHTLTATYAGDAVYAGSTSSVLTQTVNQATTTLALASSANPSGLGVSVTFTATVSAGTATGTVTFKDGADTIGTGTVTAGVATITTNALTLGSHSLTAEYPGDASYMGSASTTLTQVVKLAATTALASSLNPSTVGASVTLTATVEPDTVTGTVTFKDGVTTLGTGTVTAGVATFTTAALVAGNRSLTAVYGGDTTYAPSTSSALTQTVNKLTTTLVLISSLNPSTVGASVTFTATVSPGAATGMVMFRDGIDILGTVALSGGVATVATSGLLLGSHSVTAEYGSDATYDVCTSNTLSQTVNVSPTVAVIGRFCALREATGLVIQWETVSEVGSLAFSLYREDAGAETLSRVTTKGLPAVGEAQGGVYRVLDAGATPGVSCRYLVEELQADGGARRYGPFEVVLPAAVGTVSVASLDGPASAVAAPLPAAGQRAGADLLLGAWPHAVDPLKTARSAARGSELKGAAAILKAAETSGTGSKSLADLTSRLRIQVATEGLKYLSAEAIASGLGSRVEEVRPALLAQQFELSCQGSAVAYVAATDGAGLYFYGRAYSSPYSVGNVYWLQPGIGIAVAPASVGAATGAALGSFAERVHREEDNDSRPDLLAAVEDGLWLWGLLQSDVEAFRTRSVDVDLPGLATTGGLATVTVRLHGGNNTAAEFDHETAVEVNGRRLGSSRWDGIVPHEASFTLDAAVLHSGLNTILVRALAPAGGAASRSYLDWVEVSYPRRYVASGDSLVFGVSGGASVAVSGFTAAGVLLFDVSDPARLTPVSGAPVAADGSGGYTLSFTAASGACRYAALLPGAAEVLSGTQVLPSGLHSTTVAAAHLIIAPPELVTAAQALADYRTSQGLPSRVASLTDVYNEFNEGLPEPGAVTAFLRWAAANWSEPPRYVVLAGDGTTDYCNRKGMNDNLMPPLLAPTAFGLFASDNAFADVSGDGIPDLAIGRLPVMTAAELTATIGKIVAYETAAPRSWAFDAVVAADRPDEGGDFVGEGERLLAGPLNGLTVKRVFLADLSLEQGRELLLKSLRFGACLTSWTGHGGLDRLSRSGVLTTADLTGLAGSGRPTVLVAASCLIGRFEIPGYDCLAERLLMTPMGGAVAVWSPSALSYNDVSSALTQRVYAEIFAGARDRLGDAVLATLRSYVPPAGGSAADLDPRTVYNLLGDPALQVHRKGQ